MSGVDERPPVHSDPLEERDRRRLRVVAAATVLTLLAFIVVVSTIAPFLGQPDLHVSEFVFGTLAGVLCLILGVEVPAWLRRRP